MGEQTMLRNWLDSVIDRLFGRMLHLVAAKLDARMAVELAAVHAELLKESERYRSDLGEGAAGLNQRLETFADEMGKDYEHPQALLASPDLKPSKKPVDKKCGGPCDKKRGRGRPRKLPPPNLPFDSKEVPS